MWGYIVFFRLNQLAGSAVNSVEPFLCFCKYSKIILLKNVAI